MQDRQCVKTQIPNPGAAGSNPAWSTNNYSHLPTNSEWLFLFMLLSASALLALLVNEIQLKSLLPAKANFASGAEITTTSQLLFRRQYHIIIQSTDS